jgi:hypothetical protein
MGIVVNTLGHAPPTLKMKAACGNIVTNKLTPKSRVLREKVTVNQPVNKFSSFCATRRFITAFTNSSAFVPALSQMNPVHEVPSDQ